MIKVEMTGNIDQLTSKNFNSTIAKGSVIVDFYADWCGPCKIMAPAFEKASHKVPTVKFAKLNVDGAQDIAQSYGIMSIPSTIAFKNGQAVDMRVGALSENDIVKMAEKVK